MQTPTVSVALCTYNGARYLDTQLRSLAGQTFLPSELVVSDDGSTDDTAAIVAEFGRTAPFPVHFHQQPTNLGVTRNFAAALALCQGELIAFCDQDDIWLPDKLKLCAEFFQTHPDCLALFTDATVVDEALHPLAPVHSLWQRLNLDAQCLARLADPATSLEVLTGPFYVTGATLVISREMLRYALPFPPDLPERMIHDGWVAAVAAALGRLNFLAQPTMLYRQHAGQQVGLINQPTAHKIVRAPREKFQTLATNYGKLHATLKTRLASEAVPGALEKVQRHAAHFQRRAGLPDSPALRAKSVLRELLDGGYHRYCRHPWLAALRDVAF